MGCFSESEPALEAAISVKPDFFVTEADLAGRNGYDVVRRLKSLIRVECIICASDSGAYKYEAITVNMSGYVSSAGGLQEIIECIQTIQKGQPYVSPALLDLLNHPTVQPMLRRLGEQERNVLRLLAQGLENDDIADKLGIKSITLNSHYKHLKEKLGLQSTRQLIVFAAQNFLKKPIFATDIKY